MGSNDTAEQLKVCHEVNVTNEARIAELENELGAAHVARTVFEAQVAELERENVRLETALADRLRHDAGGTAQLEADLAAAHAAIARILGVVDPRRDDPAPITAAAIRRVLDAATAEPVGIYLSPDDAHVAARALRGLAGIIAATRWSTDGDPAHTDTDRLTAIADRLAP